MSKKHFIALADAIRQARPKSFDSHHVGWSDKEARENQIYAETAELQWIRDINAIADVCKQQNSQFNRERWIDYINGECGPSGGKVVAK